MSKVESARKIVEANPEFNRKQLIEAFMSQLGMTKAGASTYAYNMTTGAGKAPAKAKVTVATVKVEGESKAEIKAKNLKTIKEVAAKRKGLEEQERKATKAKMQQEIDDFTDEAEAYVKNHAPKFLRAELGL